MSGATLLETKHGLPNNTKKIDALVFEKYDNRFADYDTKGKLLFLASGVIASDVLTVNLNIKPGAKVWAFPMIPYTVTSANKIVFDTTEYADSGNISDGNEVLVAVLADQSDVIESGQPH